MRDVVSNVLGKIEARTAKNLERLERIDARLDAANRKIETLKDSKKAVIIFSPSKYPETLQDFEPTFDHEAGRAIQAKKVTAGEVQSTLDPVINKQPREKLQFYHVRFDETKVPKKVPPVLGVHVPLSLIRSVDSLLVFKKDERHEKSKASSSSSFPIEGRKLDAAPASISNKTHSRQVAEELFYTPGMDTAPELDVPTDLPNLPGIAGDISFSLEDDFMIVPSQSKVNFSIQADAVDNTKTPSVTSVSQDKTLEQSESQPAQPIPAPRSVAPPPQPAVASQPKEDYIIPPPPPPPMAMQPPPPMVKQQEAAPVQSNEARSNLMAAIRSAGGKTKLRAAADRAPKQEKKKEKAAAAAAAPAGDLMSDLRNRLTMRRKGISGAKEQGQKPIEPSSMMSRISQLIPPPSFDDDNLPREAGSDEDWN